MAEIANIIFYGALFALAVYGGWTLYRKYIHK